MGGAEQPGGLHGHHDLGVITVGTVLWGRPWSDRRVEPSAFSLPSAETNDTTSRRGLGRS